MEFGNARVPVLLEQLARGQDGVLQALYASYVPQSGKDVPLLTYTLGNVTVPIPIAPNDWSYARFVPGSGVLPIMRTARERAYVPPEALY
jgi:hypothetical protein